MPSPEYHYQRRAEWPPPSPHLQAIVADLAEYYEVDLGYEGARFNIARPEQDKQWVIANFEGQHIDVARCPVKDDAFMVPDLDVRLAVTPNGWQTEKVVYSAAGWQVYAASVEQGQPPDEQPVNFPFFAFTEYVAQLIEAEARLAQASDAADVKAWFTLE